MDISEILEKPEGKQHDFKEEFPDGKKLARTVISFANQGGGYICFGGKDEPREITGFDESQDLIDLEEQISSHIYDLVTTTPDFEIATQYLENHEKHILLVEVFPGRQKPYHIKDKSVEEGTYIRVGSENRLADEQTIEELKRQSRGESFDEIPVGTKSIDDLSEKLFEDFVTKRKEVRDVNEVEYSEVQLKQLDLVTESAGATHPTIGGFLLFNEEPEEEFPQVIVRCARFKGLTMEETIDEDEKGGPLIKLPDEIMKFFKKNVNRGSKIEGTYREEAYEYPKLAIREAVINAICHRDYSIQGSEVKFAIFDDRIELSSPGGLPGRLSVDVLGSGVSEIRNPVIARVFHQMGLIEKYGSGFQKIFDGIEVRGLPDPELLDTGSFFKITFRLKEPIEEKLKELDLDEDQEKLIQYIQEKGNISTSRGADLIGKTDETARKKLKKLAEFNLLKAKAKSETDPTRVYVIKD